MMRQTATLRWTLFLWLLLCMPTRAAETPNDQPHVKALRLLAVNRSLLTRAENEYKDLLKKEAQDTTGTVSKQLSDLRYKIQAFQEDALRLQDLIPEDEKAALPLEASPNPIDTVAEKKVEEKVGRIYRMHEKALKNIAEKRFEAAERLYEEIILLSPDDDEAYMLLGHSCLASGNYQKAADAFRNAMHIDPTNIREIPRLYENILVENPSDDEALTQLGYAHLLLGSVEKARDAFRDALSVNPDNEEAKKGLLEIP